MLNCVRYLSVDVDSSRRYRTGKKIGGSRGETELLTRGNENVARILEMRGFVLF
jgi:hypothetical protein